MKNGLLSLGIAFVVGTSCVFGAAIESNAQEKKKSSLSESTVRVIMSSAFAGLPEELPNSKGEMVKLDRSDPKLYLIPLDEARRVIVHAVIGARAQLCGFDDLKRQHITNLMKHERAKKKWTPHQLVFIDHMAAAVESFLTGQAAVGDDAKKDEDPNKDIAKNYKCTGKESRNVKKAVEEDIKRLADAS